MIILRSPTRKHTRTFPDLVASERYYTESGESIRICYTCHTYITTVNLMLAVRIPEELETRLENLARLTGRPKSYYVREALHTHLEEIEDTYTALYRLEHPAKRWTLDEIEQGSDER